MGGNGISIGGLYLARLQTLFSVITSARFTGVSQDHLARGHSHPSTCVRKLRFSGLFRGVLPPDNCWPDGGLTLSEILPKTGLVTILASRSTESGPDPSPPPPFCYRRSLASLPTSVVLGALINRGGLYLRGAYNRNRKTAWKRGVADSFSALLKLITICIDNERNTISISLPLPNPNCLFLSSSTWTVNERGNIQINLGIIFQVIFNPCQLTWGQSSVFERDSVQ